jgi:hypothetical protein
MKIQSIESFLQEIKLGVDIDNIKSSPFARSGIEIMRKNQEVDQARERLSEGWNRKLLQDTGEDNGTDVRQ